jgi:hypothetical protein
VVAVRMANDDVFNVGGIEAEFFMLSTISSWAA